MWLFTIYSEFDCLLVTKKNKKKREKKSLQQSRSPAENPLGRAACWVDDNFASAVELSGVSDVQEATPTYV